MSIKSLMSKLKRYRDRLDGCTVEYDLSAYRAILDQVDTYKLSYELKTDDELRIISRELRENARNKTHLDELLPQAFSLVREAVRRVLHLNAFDEQIIGAMVLHQGKLAEMQTGEGKTLAAVFAAYLNSLTAKGVHILTFNDYLAKRDALWMGPVYAFLGVSVGSVLEGMSIGERKQAYAADVTYLTARESGFDFLRDTLCYEDGQRVQRGFCYAIIDEADSILIDEARIPLVIAEAVEMPHTDVDTRSAVGISRLVKEQLQEKQDFAFDEYSRNLYLTDHGVKRVEEILGCENLYDENNSELIARVSHALHAHHLLLRDRDYIVRNGSVELVDEFTGRVADKRRWPDGLHTAVEAKEELNTGSKGRILNSISLHYFVQNYTKIGGMTATAQAAHEEFRTFYNLHVVVIPPHNPCVRIDHQDIICATKEAKQQALIEEIVSVHKTNRPILVGTSSIHESAMLAEALRLRDVNCQVLNAKQDEREAHVIAQAGKSGAVTISTNMAGRGTDIRLGGTDDTQRLAVAALGGLYVIGTNKHESSRIDNQLRGRAGRQGDPGSSRYFVSLEDELFVKYRLEKLLPKALRNQTGSAVIDNPVFKNEISRVQRIIEGQNLEIKITLCRYSFMVERQRGILFEMRRDSMNAIAVSEFFQKNSPDQYSRFCTIAGEDLVRDIGRRILIMHIDTHWSEYLAEVNDIREGIHLRRYGSQDPLHVFNNIVIDLFETVQEKIQRDSVETFNNLQVSANSVDSHENGLKAPSATWTYLVNDNPFETAFLTQSVDSVGLSFGVLLAWPLMLLYPLLKKLQRAKSVSN